MSGAERLRGLARSPCGAVALGIAALVLVAVVVHLPHLEHGGFYGDDWGSEHRYDAARGLPGSAIWHSIDKIVEGLGGRPLQAVAITLSHAFFGLDYGAYHVLALAIAVIVAVLFYLLLRAVKVPALIAWMIAALTLVFPYSDAARLWPTESTANIATVFALAGALIALRGLEQRGRRAVLVHAVALACYLASVLTYEAAAVAILLSGLLYRSRLDWRALRTRWAADAVVVLAAVGWVYERTRGLRPTATPSSYLSDLLTFAHKEVELVGRAVVPVDVPGVVRFLVVAAIVLAAVSAFGSERRWLMVALIALVALVATCVPFIGSGLHALDSGEYDRVNMVGALPMAALVAGLVLAATRASRGGPQLAAGVAILTLLGVQYAHLTRQHIVLWDAAAEDQRQLLATLERALPNPSAGTVVYAFGAPATTTPGVFVFSSASDLDSAVNVVIWRGRGADAFPVTQPTRVVCAPHSVIPLSRPNVFNSAAAGFGAPQGGRYGRVVFIDAATGRMRRIADRASCRSALAADFAPGPLVGRLGP